MTNKGDRGSKVIVQVSDSKSKVNKIKIQDFKGEPRRNMKINKRLRKIKEVNEILANVNVTLTKQYRRNFFRTGLLR